MVHGAPLDEVVRADLAAATRISHLAAPDRPVSRVLLGSMLILNLGGQDPERLSTICVLAPAIDEDLESSRLMRHSDSRISLVLVLPAFAVTALSLDRDLRLRDKPNLPIKHGKYGYCQVRCLASAVLFGRRNPLDAMLAGLILEDRPGVLPCELGDIVPFGFRQQLALQPASPGVFEVGREQVFSEEPAVIAALTPFDFEYDFSCPFEIAKGNLWGESTTLHG
jgi:hypothetical protein